MITKATFGGAQRYVFDLATNLPQHEYEAGVAYGVHGRLAEMLEQKGIPVYAIPSLERDIGLVSDIKSFFEIKKMLRATMPDVLHLNSSKAAALGALAARFAGIRGIVFTVHGWPCKEDRSVLARWLMYIVSWITAVLSTRVIVVSKTDEELGLRMWWVRKKITFIPLGR